ncbi:extracellular solute-binding protein [Streptomyces sp. NPDC005423]|uniref:extracellular solute-binding protein n=1 Tax=Streptomyces sp. NPDC005423 TaxID=3155343 RepID=UPI0033BD1255
MGSGFRGVRGGTARRGAGARVRRGVSATALTAATASLALLATACGSGGGSAGGGNTLQAYVYGDGSTKVQEAAVAEYNKTAKVKVHLNEIPGSGYANKLRAAMGSPNAPDIFFNWGGGSIKPYVDNNQLLDLTPYLKADPALRKAFLPSVLAAGALGGKNYGIPMRGMQPVILFYNKTMFAKYHLQAPDTWSAMQTAITTLKSHGVTPFALGGADTWPSQMWLEYLVDRIGGPGAFKKIENGDASGWGDPAVLKAAQLVKSLIKQGAFGSNFTSVAYTNNAAPTLFGTGKAGMHLMGSWDYSNQLSNHASFAKNDEAWTTFPEVPGGTGDPADVVGNPTNYWSVSAKTKNKDAAVAFLKAMAKPSYSKRLVSNGDIPTTTSAQSLLGSAPSPEFATFQFQLVQKAPSFQLSWDQALPSSQATAMTTEISKLFAGQVSPEKFVDDMKAVK